MLEKGMTKISHRKSSEILKRATLQKPCDGNSVEESVVDKIAGRDFRLVTKLEKSFLQEVFLVNTAEFIVFLEKDLTFTT